MEYEWDFGDGSEHTFSSEAMHTYTSFGEYTVRVTVRDNAGGSGRAEQVIRVSDIRLFSPSDGDRIGWWEPSGAKILLKAGGLAFEPIEKMYVYLDGEYLDELFPYGGVFELYWWCDRIPDGEHRIYAKAKLKSGKEIITAENKFYTHNSIDVGGEWISTDFQNGPDIWYGINENWERTTMGIIDLGNYWFTGKQPGDMGVELEPAPNTNNSINMCRHVSDPDFKIRIHGEAGQKYNLSIWRWGPDGFLWVYVWSYIDGYQYVKQTLSVSNTIEIVPNKTDIICIAFIGVSFTYFIDDIHFVRTE